MKSKQAQTPEKLKIVSKLNEYQKRNEKGKGKQSENCIHGVMMISVKVTQRMSISGEQSWIT